MEKKKEKSPEERDLDRDLQYVMFLKRFECDLIAEKLVEEIVKRKIEIDESREDTK